MRECRRPSAGMVLGSFAGVAAVILLVAASFAVAPPRGRRPAHVRGARLGLGTGPTRLQEFAIPRPADRQPLPQLPSAEDGPLGGHGDGTLAQTTEALADRLARDPRAEVRGIALEALIGRMGRDAAARHAVAMAAIASKDPEVRRRAMSVLGCSSIVAR